MHFNTDGKRFERPPCDQNDLHPIPSKILGVWVGPDEVVKWKTKKRKDGTEVVVGYSIVPRVGRNRSGA